MDSRWDRSYRLDYFFRYIFSNLGFKRFQGCRDHGSRGVFLGCFGGLVGQYEAADCALVSWVLEDLGGKEKEKKKKVQEKDR